jgi:hypothetical protein
MDRTRVFRAASIAVAVFGASVAVGALSTGLGFQTGIDGDSLLVGAGIAVAGAGAAVGFQPRPRDTVSDEGVETAKR